MRSVARAHLSTAAFDRRRTSHPVAVPRTAGTTIPHSQGHRARENGPTLYYGIYSHCLRRSARPDPTGLIRPRGTRDDDSAFRDASDWLHDSTRRDLAMLDISREGNEQLAGECCDRDAADPAALGANALAEPTAESTGGLVSHPHPGKLDHCGTQTRIACLRDALFVVDAATLPWAGSQAGIGRQLASVLKVAEQALKVRSAARDNSRGGPPHPCRFGARADPGATSRRGHNRRKSDEPMNQARMSTNTELSKPPTATPSHCAQIEALPLALCPCRVTWAILRPGRLTDVGWPLASLSQRSANCPS